MRRHIFLFALAFPAFSVYADVFFSVNCGSSVTYTDENQIAWTPDNDFMQNGDSHTVKNPDSVSTVLSTLRSFTTRKKNCYSIEATQGERVLVRASFYYGNYDNKSSPPTFDLQLDGNYWATIEALNSGSSYVYNEVIYIVRGNSVNVCVAQTKPGQIPFMSALEVRSLGSRMYSHIDANYPLYLMRRVAFAANGTTRFPDDPYDRIWNPSPAGNGLTEIATDGSMNGVVVSDIPPPIVMQNAITSVNPRTGINFIRGFPTTVDIPVYINMYFSEILLLDSTETRSFQITMDNVPLMESPVVPPTEVYSSNLTVSSNTTLSLVPTNDSTLPPLINALEVFLIGDVLANGTNSSDVKGLASLQTAFAQLQDWSGEPCLPATYSWDWINCSADSTPRVTALYLNSFNLSGELPDFSSMDALETIDFHNNTLDGSIPVFLASLPNLKHLNLASNQLSGPIPDALSKKNNLNLVVTGNPDLCSSGSSCRTTTGSSPGNNGSPGVRSSPGSNYRTKKKNKLPVILGTIIPIFIILWTIAGVFFILRHKKKTLVVATTNAGQNGTPLASPMNATQALIGKMFKTRMSDYKVDLGNVELPDQTNQEENGNANGNGNGNENNP